MNVKNKLEGVHSSLNAQLESFSQRLEAALGKKSARSLAISCGMSPNVVSKYLNGESTPNVERLVAIAEALDVSVDWLATGKGPAVNTAVETLPAGQEPHDDEFVYISDLRVEASAGHGAEVGIELVSQKLAFRKDWIQQQGLNPQKLTILWARGDSMEPTIMDGDALLVETLFYLDGNRYEFGTPDGLPPRDGVYIIRLDGHLVVKRIQLDMQGGYFVKSDNEAYKELHITRAQLHAETQEPKPEIAGRVVWFGRSI